jgi:succinyl-CoA synthetase alpha subunit
MEECGITVAESPSIIGKTLFNKLSNWKILLEYYIE